MSGPGRRAVQRIAALVVLLGIVAMHQLTGGSHTAGHAAGGTSAATLSLPATGAATAPTGGSAATALPRAAPAPHETDVAAAALPAVTGSNPHLTAQGIGLGHWGVAACLAVLVALLALTPPGHWTRRVSTRLSLAAAAVPPLRAARGPAHPLVSLCVLRT